MIINRKVVKTESTEKWVRPSDWPQYTPSMIEAPFEGMYYTLDLTAAEIPYVAFALSSDLGVIVESGDLINGVFTAVTSETVASGSKQYELLPDANDYATDYAVFKITPVSGGKITNCKLENRWTLSNGLYQDSNSLIVEVYGRLPNATSFARDSYAHNGDALLQSFTLKDINATNLLSMFEDCKNLQNADLSFTSTALATNVSRMFFNCYALKELDLSSFNTSAVTNMSGMFYNCYALKELDLSSFNTSAVTNMNDMFRASGTESLSMCDGATHQYPKTGTAVNTWVADTDTSSLTTAERFLTYQGPFNLTTITHFPSIPLSFRIDATKVITVASLLVVLNALPTVSGKTLTLGSTNLAKLTDDQKAIATEKGWTLA